MVVYEKYFYYFKVFEKKKIYVSKLILDKSIIKSELFNNI